MTKLALVLSGGGSKGAYQIGVYRALKKLKKNPQIITGTSVGAINGLLITQGDLYKAVKLWENISFSTIYEEKKFEECDNEKIISIYKEYIKAFMNEGGIDTYKLIKIFDKMYNPKKFFLSPIKYGLVTYNYTKNKPVVMTKDEFKEDNVKDYVIASASCYPAFKPYKIGTDLYIDGGYYDNMPVNLALDLGAEEIVAVDLRAVGLKRKPKTSVPTTIISPRNKIVSFLVFDKIKSREALRFGYNDTMKTYGKLDGDKFTFKKKSLIKNYNLYYKTFEQNLNNIFFNIDKKNLKLIVNNTLFKNIINQKLSYRNFNKLVEKAGMCFDIPEDTIYSIKRYNKQLLKKINEIKLQNKKNLLKKIVDHKQIVRFFYESIIDGTYQKSIKYLPMFIDDFFIALYIYVIKNNKKYL